MPKQKHRPDKHNDRNNSAPNAGSDEPHPTPRYHEAHPTPAGQNQAQSRNQQHTQHHAADQQHKQRAQAQPQANPGPNLSPHPLRRPDPQRGLPGRTAGGARTLLASDATKASNARQLLLHGLMHFETGDNADHVARVANVPVPGCYKPAFDRWKAAAEKAGANTWTLTTAHPLAIGLGNISPTEVGITLHPVYGVPFVPGDALKNVAKRGSADFDGDPEERASAQRRMFGSDNPPLAGAVTFWGGWCSPNTPAMLVQDVMTPHHTDYYQSGGAVPPTDFDDPNPVAFLTVPKGVAITFAVGTSEVSPSWKQLARDFATWGLQELGTGAKTKLGYGRFEKP